ncbi:MAG: hypothetical protein ISN29_01680, partial [Gammaproteobacteria bacterium AqS3]|nr:hypothetical protein [Gammaproteobacteria bacterium AqS3]
PAAAGAPAPAPAGGYAAPESPPPFEPVGPVGPGGAIGAVREIGEGTEYRSGHQGQGQGRGQAQGRESEHGESPADAIPGGMSLREVSAARKINIAIVGVGGAGNNVLRYLASSSEIEDANYIAINTDGQSLGRCQEVGITCVEIFADPDEGDRGLGAGGVGERARMAAEFCRELIQEHLQDCDLVLLVGGMGKGTGAGASPVIADISKQLGILCIAMAIMPFGYEMRDKVADDAVEKLSKAADTHVLLYNERLSQNDSVDPHALDEISHDKLYDICNQYIVDLLSELHSMLTRWGTGNIDFADLRSVVSKAQGGRAVIGVGMADEEVDRKDAPSRAVIEALDHPVLDRERLHSASGVLLHLSGPVYAHAIADAMKQLKAHFPRSLGDASSPPITGYRHVDEGPLRAMLILTGLQEHPNYGDDIHKTNEGGIDRIERVDTMNFYRSEIAPEASFS